MPLIFDRTSRECERLGVVKIKDRRKRHKPLGQFYCNMSLRTTRSSTKRAAGQLDSPSTPSSASDPKKRKKSQSAPTKSSAKVKSNSQPEPTEALQIVEEIGDIFSAPPNTLIIHACNCDGSWGGGIAKAFKDRYPKAYDEYAKHCEQHGHSLLSTAQLIPPVDAETAVRGEDGSKEDDNDIPKHFVGCLFTSRHFGRKKDSPTRILKATKPAMEDLLKQINAWDSKVEKGDQIEEVRMCKINSGLFAVPWEKSKALLEKIDVSSSGVKIIKIVSPKA